MLISINGIENRSIIIIVRFLVIGAANHLRNTNKCSYSFLYSH